MDDITNFDSDYLLALKLQEQFEEELREIKIQNNENVTKPAGKFSDNTPLPVSLVDKSWELVDPNPDVYALFCTYNEQFFWGKLHAVAVSWSPRMTRCAGVCSYERRGGLCSIRLSVPLLKLRPRSDLVETLLHEMIHAYLFVTANNRDRDGHGPEFHKHMYRINNRAGTNITVFHSFHSEVAMYQQHVWQCTGPCRQRGPYYGLVKRSMNRAPGPNDRWWADHEAMCGGRYVKVKEPEGYAEKSSSQGKKGKKSAYGDIRKYITQSKNKISTIASSTSVIGLGDIRGSHSISLSGNSQNLGQEGSRSNIHGFVSTATGAITSVNVSNSSRSNIVGFKGLNRTTNSKRIKNKDRNPSRGKYSKGLSGGEERASGSGGEMEQGSGVRVGFGGSGTILVKPRLAAAASATKTTSQTSNDKDSDVEGAIITTDVKIFSSKGFVLESSLNGVVGFNDKERKITTNRNGRPISRLVLEYDNGSKKCLKGTTSSVSSLPDKQEQNFVRGKRKASESEEKSCSSANKMLETTKKKGKTCDLVENSTSALRNASYATNFCSRDSNLLLDSDESEDSESEATKSEKPLHRECPLCRCTVARSCFKDHIALCLGDWDTEQDFQHSDSNGRKAEEENELEFKSDGSLEDKYETSGTFNSNSFQKAKSRSNKKSSNENATIEDTEYIEISDTDEEFDLKYYSNDIMVGVHTDRNRSNGISNSEVMSSESLRTGSSQNDIGEAVHCTETVAGWDAGMQSNEGGLVSEPKYPCPVCGQMYTESYISRVHLDTHFL